jgi:hypothetical protein
MVEPTHITADELVPQIDDSNPFADSPVGHPATPIVLDAIDDDHPLRRCTVSLLCPGCSGLLARYREGLPRRLAYVDEECSQCETTLRRWSIAAINTAYETTPTPSELQSIVTDYWEENLWEGIVTGEHCARTEEYTRAYSMKARDFGWEWEVTCPLCRQSLDELGIDRLDYHHWRREPDQGICLCRTCHVAVSGGKCDADQDWEAQRLGLADKHDLQITRLALREQAFSEHGTLAALVDTIHDRYNLVQTTAEVYDLLVQTLQSTDVLIHVDDSQLLTGL